MLRILAKDQAVSVQYISPFEIIISVSVAARQTELLTIGLQWANQEGGKKTSQNEIWKLNLPLQQSCHFEKFVSNHLQYGLPIRLTTPLDLVSNFANSPSQHRIRGMFRTIFCSTFSTFSSSSDLLNGKQILLCPVGVRPVGALL